MITILGNGPVGLILERICQLKQWDYTLVGPSTYPNSNKLILLTPKNIHFLQTLGFSIPQHRSFSQLRITSHLAKLPCYLPKTPKKQPLCYAIWLQDLLKGLNTFSKPSYEKITSGKSSPHLSLSTPNEDFETEYLIGCDGSSSLSAKIAGITYQDRQSYHCIVIPANIEGNLLIQKHSSRYILAVIPDSNGSIVISSQYPLQNITPSLKSLQRMVGTSATIYSIQEPIHFSLRPKIATTNFKKNVLLLGNAALTIEPVAAKGLNHAIDSLRLIHALQSPLEIPKQALEINKTNKILFSQMHHIVNPSAYKKLIHKIGFYSQIISPLFQDSLLNFGDPYD